LKRAYFWAIRKTGIANDDKRNIDKNR